MSVRKQGTLLFGLLFFCYAYVHQGMGWNQNSRLDLLHALFREHTFKIDSFHENTGNKSIYDGHYYSDKAPGIALLAAPAFALSLAILKGCGVSPDSPQGWLASSWITTAGSVGWITALGGVAMFAFLARLVGQRYAYITTLAVFLGSLPFPYATMLFSHAAVIGLLCIALWAIADPAFWFRMMRFPTGAAVNPPADQDVRLQSDGPVSLSSSTEERAGVRSRECPQASRLTDQPRHWLRRHLLAGLCCGLAIASEYTAALAAGGVLALALLTSPRRGLVLALAAVPPLLLIPLYNWACFGGPLAFGYHHLALTEFQQMNSGLFGITFPPKAGAIYLILLSPERGLFLWTPFFLMAFAGAHPLWKGFRNLFLIAYYVILLHVLCISAYYMPSGGAALGPRHFAPMLPFAAAFAALGLQRCSRIGFTLAYCSVLLTGLGTVVNAMPPENMPDLLWNFYVRGLTDGRLTDNLTQLLGISAAASLAPICIVVIVAWLLLAVHGRGPAVVEAPLRRA